MGNEFSQTEAITSFPEVFLVLRGIQGEVESDIDCFSSISNDIHDTNLRPYVKR